MVEDVDCHLLTASILTKFTRDRFHPIDFAGFPRGNFETLVEHCLKIHTKSGVFYKINLKVRQQVLRMFFERSTAVGLLDSLRSLPSEMHSFADHLFENLLAGRKISQPQLTDEADLRALCEISDWLQETPELAAKLGLASHESYKFKLALAKKCLLRHIESSVKDDGVRPETISHLFAPEPDFFDKTFQCFMIRGRIGPVKSFALNRLTMVAETLTAWIDLPLNRRPFATSNSHQINPFRIVHEILMQWRAQDGAIARDIDSTLSDREFVSTKLSSDLFFLPARLSGGKNCFIHLVGSGYSSTTLREIWILFEKLRGERAFHQGTLSLLVVDSSHSSTKVFRISDEHSLLRFSSDHMNLTAPLTSGHSEKRARITFTGRRKTSVARVRLKSGTGKCVVNGKPVELYFRSLDRSSSEEVSAPLRVVGLQHRYDVVVQVSGGGLMGQVGAIKLGIARAILSTEPSFRSKLKGEGLLTRDSRMKERKKYGQPGARKRFQFSKR